MFTACAVTVCFASLLMGQSNVRVPKPRKGMVFFVGHATAATTIEEGKRIALDDVCHQILVYAGAEVHSALSKLSPKNWTRCQDGKLAAWCE